MKQKSKRIMLMTAGLLLTAFLLSACHGGLEKTLREKAENYLSTLAEKSGIADRFNLSTKGVDLSAKADPIGFSVRSETYGEDFTVFVSRDGKTVTDTYYTLSLKEKAQKEAELLFQAALAKDAPSANIEGPSVSFKPVSDAGLSGRGFDSLKDFCGAAGSLPPLVIQVKEKEAGRDQLTENEINLVLQAMQKQGIQGTFYPYASSAVWFEVFPDKVWKVVQSGADGGAMMQREEYLPTAIPESIP